MAERLIQRWNLSPRARLACCALVLACLALVLPARAAAAPVLFTDKADYAPGEVVHVTGMGFEPNTAYDLPVRRPSGDIVLVDPATHESTDGWDTVTSDANGDLQYDYQLNGVLGSYTVRAYPESWSGDWNEVPLAERTFTDASSTDLDQCRNGTFASPVQCTGSAWVNGNANSTQAHFLEGDSQTYRMKLTDLDIGVYTLRITYDTTDSGRHGIDYLTSFDRTETTADPCTNVSFTVTGGCNANAPQSTFPIPADFRVTNGPDGLPTGLDNITQAAGNIELFGNATITAVGAPTLTSGTYTVGTGYVGTTQTSVDVTFTVGADDTNLIIAWGGHISVRSQWSPELTAAHINGSSYHMRNGGLSFNGGSFAGGSQDRQLSAGAVIAPGSVTIVKQATPEGSTSFPFTSSHNGSFSLVDDGTTANTTTFSNITDFSHDYTFTETPIPAGWTLSGINCVEAGLAPDDDSDDSGATAEADVDEGEDVTCTFTNTRQTSLTIEKDTVPNALADFAFAVGGSGLSSFSLDDDASVAGADNTLLTTKTFTNISTGDKYVRETPAVSGYTITDISCTGDTTGVVYGRGGTTSGTFVNGPSTGFESGDDTVKVPLDAGEQVSCKFTNTRDTGTLRVIKNVVNDNGGTLGASAFNLHVKQSGTDVSGSPAAGSATGTVYTLSTGSYDVSEDAPPSGYAQTGFSGNCNSSGVVTVVTGQEVTCTITNNDIAPTITVNKVLTPSTDGGTFNLQIDGSTAGTGAGVGNGGTTGAVSVSAGSHTVGETGAGGTDLDNYVRTIGGDCATDGTVSAALGETKTCTITNVRKGTVIIEKVRSGGDASDSFSFDPSADLDPGVDFSLTGGQSKAYLKVVPNGGAGGNTYEVTEGASSTYDLTSVNCYRGASGTTVDSDSSGDTSTRKATIEVDPGETVRCVFTNTRKTGTLRVKKSVTNDHGGTLGPADFNLHVKKSGTDVSGSPAAGSTTGTVYTLETGAYAVSEDAPPAGYTQVGFTGDCDTGGAVTVAAGVERTCTITNDDIAPTITVNKVVDPVSDSGSFNLRIDGTTLATGGNGTTTNAVPVQAGSHTVSETGAGGTDLSDYVHTIGGDCATDGTVSVALAQNKICTITNVRKGTVIVEKVRSGGDASDSFSFDPSADLDSGADFNLTGGQSKTYTKVVPNGGAGGNTYAVVEGASSTYDLTSIDCYRGATGTTVDSDSSGDPSTRTATIEVDPGETVRCVFTNTRKTGTLRVKKVVNNDWGGTKGPGDFNLHVKSGATDVSGSPQAGSASGTDYVLNTGTYRVSEDTPLPAGYEFDGFSGCDAQGDVTVTQNQVVTCTLTNSDKPAKLTVTKAVDPTTDTGSFNLRIDSTTHATGGHGTTTNAINVAAGSHTVSETGAGGTDLTDYVSTIGGACAADGTVSLALDEAKSCTITNVRKGTVIVEKVRSGGDASDSFAFDPSADLDPGVDFSLTGGQTKTYTKVVPNGGAGGNTYEVTEGASSLYDLSSVNCYRGASGTTADTDSSGDTATRKATIEVDPGETVRCVFTNTRKTGTLRVKKLVTNDHGGTLGPADFNLHVKKSGTDVSGSPAAGSSTGTVYTLETGSFDVSEDAPPAGYTQVGFTGDCNGSGAVTVVANQEATCTITNDDIAPTLTVNKAVDPTTDSGSFNLRIDGTTHATGGHATTTNAVALSTGSHTVTETAAGGTDLADYVSTIGGDCAADGTVSLALAENKTCTITNVRKGTVIVEKVNSGGAASDSFAFDPSTDLDSGADFNLTGGQSKTYTRVVPNGGTGGNTYTVEEAASSTYDLSSIDCYRGATGTTVDGDSSGDTATRKATIEVDPGETVRCVFTNTRHTGTLRVKKSVNNDHGGTKGPSDFNLHVKRSGADVTGSPAAGSSTGTVYTLPTGTYDVSEDTPLPAGYEFDGFSDGCNASGAVTVTKNAEAVCTLTNDDIAPTLTVNKVVDPATDGGKFNLRIDGSTAGTGGDVGHGGTTGAVPLVAGQHTVSETAGTGTTLDDYGAVISGDCAGDGTVTLALAEDKTCTITNTRKAEVTIVKQTDPDETNGETFGFQTTLPGAGTFSLADDGTEVRKALPTGQTPLTVTEDPEAGYRLESIACDETDGVDNSTVSKPDRKATLNLEAGEKVTCTFTNLKIVGAVLVLKAGNEFVYHGETINYSFDVSNAGNSPLSNVKVTDDRCANVSAAPVQKHNDDGDALLEPKGQDGINPEVWVFTCSMPTPAHSAGEENPIVNTATASGDDEEGKPVTDTDQHSTRILHQAIDIAKTGPASATAGETVRYTLTVTNPGETAFPEAQVKVADPLCTPQLTGKGADASPGTLDPGDTWTYSCDVSTRSGQTSVDNTATVDGTDVNGRTAQDTASARTTLAEPPPPQVVGQQVAGQQQVKGTRARTGAAVMRGPDGCVRKAFTAYVRGREIRDVTWYLDGRKLRVVTKKDRRGRYNVRVNPSAMKQGAHRLNAVVRFTARSSTRPKTIRVTFQRCARARISPAFTG